MADVQFGLDQAAALLGVHYQTVYRWVRSGRLPAVKVDGRYMVAKADLDALQESRHRAEGPPAPSVQRLHGQQRAMDRALRNGDETAARRLARRLVADGTPVTALIQEVIVPPMVRIGEDWRAGTLSIYVEHRASAIVTRLLGEFTPNPAGRRRGTAVVASLSGDHHFLPTMMATAALREENWTVQHLGSDVPPDQIQEFMTLYDVDLLVLSATGTEARSKAHSAKHRFEREGVPTLVGSAGSTLQHLQRLAKATVSSG